MSKETRRKAIQNLLSKTDPFAKEVDICIGVVDWESPGILHYYFTYKVTHPGIWEGARDDVAGFLSYFGDGILEASVVDQRIDEEAKKKGNLPRL